MKSNARKRAYRALLKGQLIKQACHCGSLEMEAHHDDYLKGGREVAKRMTSEQRKAKAMMMVQARERKRQAS
jgi:hypothetical protein